MGLNDGVSNKKCNTDLDDEGVISVGEVGPKDDYSGEDNDELTNLTWLQDRNLLKSMTSVASGIPGRGCSLGVNPNLNENLVHFIKEENENHYPDDDCSTPEDDSCSNNNNNSKDDGCSKLPSSVPPVPYNPKVHIHAKPPYSFSSLIFMAIESSSTKALPVKDIYAWIVEHFPYYQSSPSGWKNTVRHNLSLNKCFKKLDKERDELVPIVGKGSLWCVDPELRPNLLQAVRRTPAHIYPYMSTAKADYKINPINDLTSSKHRTHHESRKILTLDPQITNSPFLGKRLLIPIINRESEETIDAAQSMLTLTRYSSEENRSLTTVKSDPIDDHMDEDSISAYDYPTGDHNYFSRNLESKKDKLKLLSEAQALTESDVNEPENNNDQMTSESSQLPRARANENNEQQKTENINLIERVIMISDNGKKSQGTGLVKRKVDINDEDGLKGAQALLNLASRSLEVKSNEEKNKLIQQQKQQSQILQLQEQAQSSILFSSSVKNIVDNVTNNTLNINTIGLMKRRRD